MNMVRVKFQILKQSYYESWQMWNITMDSFIHVFIYSLAVCLHGCLIGTESYAVNNTELDLFSELLKLQNENCDAIRICAFTNDSEKGDIRYEIKEPSCCFRCSCSRRCAEVQANDVTDGKKYNNLSKDVTGSRKYDNLSESVGLTDHLEGDVQTMSEIIHLVHDTTDVTSCVSTRLIFQNIMYGFKGVQEAFLAVSKCPVLYKNDAIRRKCESSVKENWTVIDELIPVTFIPTKTTYKNVFCLQCNENHVTNYLTWKSLLTCSHKNVIQDFIQPPVKLFRSISSKSFTFCNIVFKPPVEALPFVEGCFFTDINSCPNTFTRDSDVMYDAGIFTDYKELCRRFLLPVLTVHKRQFIVYRNIACYLCNSNSTFPKKCPNMYPDYSEYNLQINILNKTRSTSMNETLSVNDIPRQNDDECGIGFIYDTDLVICRKILCPRHFYIHNGKCRPSISRVDGVYFNLVIEIRPSVFIPMSENLLDQYESKLESVLAEQINQKFKLLKIFMWRKISNFFPKVNIVSVNFKSEQETYSGIIEKTRLMLLKIKYVKIEINSNVISLETELSDHLYEIDRFHRAIERETKSSLQKTRISKKFKVDEKVFRLSKGHFCYRLELNSSEYVITGKTGIKILKTGTRVKGAYFDITEDGNRIACVEDVIEIKDTVTDLDTSRQIGNTQDKEITVVLVFGVTIALIILIMIGRIMFKCCKNNET